MNATATLTNHTGKRKRITQCDGQVLEPNESVEIGLDKVVYFLDRPGWRVDIPPEAGEFKDAGGRMALYFLSPVGVADGYGNHAEDILLGLDGHGVRLTARHLWQLNPAGLDPRTLKLLQQPITTINAVGLCMATPGEFHHLPTPFKVGLTMYESTDYRPRHPEWTAQINEVDLLLTVGVDDEWNVPVFQRCGVRVPIRPVRGAGNRHFYTEAACWQAHDRAEFVVISWGMMHSRKSTLEMIDVFKRAFPRNKYPGCRFRIKTVGGVIGDLPPGSYKPDDARVEVISVDWLPGNMVEFAKNADVMLYLARGEGNGRPPREAMAMGLPLICANNSAMQPICEGRYMTPVETKKWVPAAIGGEWAEPDWDQAVEGLRWQYEHRDEARRKARAGRQWMLRQHSPTIQCLDIILALEQVNPDLAKRSRDWVPAYMPHTDHAPGVEAVQKAVPDGDTLTLFGPETMEQALRKAGVKTAQRPGEVAGMQGLGDILRAALSKTSWAVLCAAGPMFPVRTQPDALALTLHQWERWLEGEQFNVAARVAYGGDHKQDYSLFVISAAARVRGASNRVAGSK